MRKRLISANPRERVSFDEGGLDLASLGMVEITSEDEAYPIECALQLGEGRGWRAAEPGPQTIRLLFDHPQKLKRIGWSSRKPKSSAHRSSSCDGLRTTDIRFEKLFASNGISARLGQYGRLRTTPWKSSM